MPSSDEVIVDTWADEVNDGFAVIVPREDEEATSESDTIAGVTTADNL